MRMRELLVAAIAAAALILCTADASMAQKKKQPQAAAGNTYKECCEKAYSRYFEQGGKRTCWISEKYRDVFYQCVQERGIRVIHGGQITM